MKEDGLNNMSLRRKELKDCICWGGSLLYVVKVCMNDWKKI